MAKAPTAAQKAAIEKAQRAAELERLREAALYADDFSAVRSILLDILALVE